MQNSHAKQTLALLLVAMLAASSCGSEPTVTDDTTTVADTTTAAPEPEYEFKENYGGEEFRILNVEDAWGMHSEIDRESSTGDMLDDAMYNRCRDVEDKLGVKLKEEFTEYGSGGSSVVDTERRLILSGDDVYDVMYVCAEQNALELGIEGGLYDLCSLDALKLYEPWWFSATNDMALRDGKLWSAAGASHLMHLDSTWVIYFNEDMMTDLGLEFPYQLVRDGKWTLDKLTEYAKKGAKLNGDSSYAFTEKGACNYGISFNGNGALWLLYGANEFVIGSENGKPIITAGSERFYNVADKLNALLGEEGTSYRMTSNPGGDNLPGSYMHMFETERSMMLAAELSKTGGMRDKEYSFGILPYPKFDENQENYYATGGMAMNFAIPVTCQTPERSAVVGDALAYLGYTDVMPIWREVTVEQKGLRNEDSIEMLGIIIDSTVARPYTLYGVGTSLVNSIANDFFYQENKLSSVIAAMTPTTNAEIAKVSE